MPSAVCVLILRRHTSLRHVGASSCVFVVVMPCGVCGRLQKGPSPCALATWVCPSAASAVGEMRYPGCNVDARDAPPRGPTQVGRPARRARRFPPVVVWFSLTWPTRATSEHLRRPEGRISPAASSTQVGHASTNFAELDADRTVRFLCEGESFMMPSCSPARTDVLCLYLCIAEAPPQSSPWRGTPRNKNDKMLARGACGSL